MPVIRPAIGDTPEAIATPIHSGSATKKTTNEANISLGAAALTEFNIMIILSYIKTIARMSNYWQPMTKTLLDAYEISQQRLSKLIL
jgi:hypothetical protein